MGIYRVYIRAKNTNELWIKLSLYLRLAVSSTFLEYLARMLTPRVWFSYFNKYFNKYMLLAGWEVRIGKNCDRGLENAARGRRPRAAFLSPRSQFFPIRTDHKPANNIFIFFFLAVNWLTSGFVYATLPLNRLTRRLQTIHKKSNERTSQ